jgi:plasmid stabilization system protein ParE
LACHVSALNFAERCIAGIILPIENPKRLALKCLHLAENALTCGAIRDGIEILERHPFVGRPCEEGLRELLISYGKSGYEALYSYEQWQDVVLVLAIPHQREAGYST